MALLFAYFIVVEKSNMYKLKTNEGIFEHWNSCIDWMDIRISFMCSNGETEGIEKMFNDVLGDKNYKT